MFNKHDTQRNACKLVGPLAHKGYDWWWHSFTAEDAETGAEKPFFIEYYLCNPALAKDTPTVCVNSGEQPSYLMVKAGAWGEDHVQLHRYFAWKDAKIDTGAPYRIEADDCFASETALRGSIHISPEERDAHPEWLCDAGDMTWDLTLDKQIAFNVGYGTSRPLRGAEAFEMYWHAEGIKTLVSGSIELNGRQYIIRPETSYGYSDKNWGSDFTSPWVWLASSCLTSNVTGKQLMNSAFDIGGGRPKVYALPLERKLLGVFYYEGEEFDFNFSHFWLNVRTEFNCQETEDEIVWHVRQENREAVMETDVRCRKSDMLLVNYVAPDGVKRHNRLWNGGNGTGRIRLYRKVNGEITLVDDVTATHIGCEYGEYDE